MSTITCACLLATRGSEILLVRVRDNEGWYLPGGKIESGETAAEAVVREVQEELSITLKPDSLKYELTVRGPAYKEAAEVELICFSGAWDTEIRPAAEISEVAWLSADQIDRFAPAVQILYSQHIRPG